MQFQFIASLALSLFLPIAASASEPVAAPAADESTPSSQPAEPAEPAARVYQVLQTTVLSDIDADAKQVRWWISIPDNERHQEVLDISVVQAPGTWSIERDRERGNRFLYVEVDNPDGEQLEATVEFTLRRESVQMEIDPARVGAIGDLHRSFYADETRRDAPNMEVSDVIQGVADRVCAEDSNPASQVTKLLRHVADSADHYSKDPSKPHCGIGSAIDCMTNGGGCCTDLHSLFISLARARGIPARLQMGYRLNPQNEGKQYDPGYRCWAEYFLPGYGWVPADIVEADAPGGLGPERWFTGLTEWRVWLNEGRDFELRPEQAGPAVNTMIIGHAEIDGRAARVLAEGDKDSQLSRTIKFSVVR